MINKVSSIIFISMTLINNSAQSEDYINRYSSKSDTYLSPDNSVSQQYYKDIKFGETIYHLPAKKYNIWTQDYDKKTNHAAFGFSAILPNLDPATSDPAEAATWGKGTGWHKEIKIMAEYGRNFVSQQQMLEIAFSDSKAMKKFQDEKEIEGRPVSRFIYFDRDNYILMPNGCRIYNGYSSEYNVIQVCNEDDSMLVIKCNLGYEPKYIPSPSCKVHFNISNRTQITYTYGYMYFYDAVSIHNKVVDLLMAFRIDAEPRKK